MSRTLPFTKMHGIGNDYIYVNCFSHPIEHPNELSERVSHRRFGVGGDGLVLILPSKSADVGMRIFNADGSEAEMCGNAIRCIGKYVYERELVKKREISVSTKAGLIKLSLQIENGEVASVRVNMGEPILEAKEIPVNSSVSPVIGMPFEIEGHKLKLTAISVGNPHAVFFVDKISDELVLGLGPKIETHPMFPNRINVEFVEVLSPKELNMRVWERGSGETFACGTGASAVAVAAVLNELCERKMTIHLKGGDLQLEWGADNHIYMTGPAEFAFDGELIIEESELS